MPDTDLLEAFAPLRDGKRTNFFFPAELSALRDPGGGASTFAAASG